MRYSMNTNPNQNSSVDNLIYLKDAPGFWRSPRLASVSYGLNQMSYQIFYSLMFGQEAPTKTFPYITRGQVQASSSKHKDAYFVGLFVPSKRLTGFSYPPVGTNQIDPAALFNAVIKHVLFIDKALYDMPISEYKPQTPRPLIDSLLVHGGKWTS